MEANVEGKVIVVTGASSGIGAAAAQYLAAEGATVVLGARRMEKLERVLRKIHDEGGKGMAIKTDVTRADQVKNLVQTAVEAYGRIDVMINNAGLMPVSPLDRLLLDEWNQMIDVNFKGVLHGIAAALPYMIRQKFGHFINTASVMGHVTSPGFAVYSATKSAVQVLSEGLRQEVKPYNIRTTILSPGVIDTELPDTISDEDSAKGTKDLYDKIGISADSYARAVAFAIGQPEDMDVNEIIFRPTAQKL